MHGDHANKVSKYMYIIFINIHIYTHKYTVILPDQAGTVNLKYIVHEIIPCIVYIPSCIAWVVRQEVALQPRRGGILCDHRRQNRPQENGPHQGA